MQYSPQKTANSYSVGNVNDLFHGQKVLIVNTANSKAMSNSGSGGKLAATSVTISSSKITAPAVSLIWTVEQDGSKFKFKNTYYVYAYSTSNTSLYCDNEDSDYPDSWTITDAGTTNYYYLYSDRSTSAKKLEYYNNNFTTYAANTTDAYKMQFFVPTYSAYITTCCTPLGQINGSLNLTQGGNSVTIKDWEQVSNAGSYTVKMYKKNGSSWDLVTGTAASADAGTQGTRTGITDAQRTSGVTFTGLVVESEYKFTIQAVASSSDYCDGEEKDVTNINSTDVSSTPFKFRYSIYIDNGSNSGWAHHFIEPTDNANEGQVSINLSAHITSYQFKIAGGLSGWWGQTGSGNIPASTKWTLDGGNNVNLDTGAGGAYVFTVDYSGTTNPGVTVTFPSANQTAGHKIYFDKSIIADWGNTLKYRIGNNSHNQNQDFTLVPGTDQFYETSTPTYDNMDAWQIANNVAWTGTPADADHGIKNYYHSGDAYNITKATDFFDYIVDGDITMVPSSKKKTENSCDFWYVNKTDGMLTHTATISATTGVSIKIDYVDATNAQQSVSAASNAGITHRAKLTVTATADAGYDVNKLYVTPSGGSESEITNGATDNHILDKDATFRATVTETTYTITYNLNGGTNGSNPERYKVTTNTITLQNPTRDGYTFGGWYENEGFSGSAVTTIAKGSTGNKQLYAKWTAINYTITYYLNGGTNNGGNPSSYTIESETITLQDATKTGYTFKGWYSTSTFTAGTEVTTIATGSTGNKTLYAKFEINTYTITWHIGEDTQTSSAEYGTKFSDLTGIPVVSDGALSACGSTKFIGWVTEDQTDDGETVDWYNSHKADPNSTISNHAEFYAMFAEEDATNKSDGTESLTESEIKEKFASDSHKYDDDAVSYEDGDITWTAKYNVDNKDRLWMQFNDASYLKITAPGKITKVEVLITSSGNQSGGINDKTKYNDFTKAPTLYLKPTTNSDAVGSVTGTTSSQQTLTINVTSGDNKELYLMPSIAYRMWSITVTYSTTALINYRTGCAVSCSRPQLGEVSGLTATAATINWTEKGTGTLVKYEYAVWKDGDTEPTSGFTAVGTTSVGLTDLMACTKYNYKVRKVCSNSDYSGWAKGSFNTADATYNVNWYKDNTAIANFTNISVTACDGAITTMPAAQTKLDCSDVFVGWSASEIMPATDVRPADLFTTVEDAPAITGDTDFHAVFASTETTSAQATNTTYTFNSKEWGDDTNSWNSTTAGSQLMNDRGIQVLGDQTAVGVTKDEYTAVTKIVVTYCTNSKTGAGTVTLKVGDTEFGSQDITAPSSGGTTLKTFELTHAATDGKVTVTASATANSIYIYSVEIYYTGSGTRYFDYRTKCCNDAGFTFVDEENQEVTELAIVREDLESSDEYGEVEFKTKSSNTSGEITWKKTTRQKNDYYATKYSWTSSQTELLTIDFENGIIQGKQSGVWELTISQASGSTAYCPQDAEVTVRVTTIDKFIDNVNGNNAGASVSRLDTGNGITLPTAADFSINDECEHTERRLVGWIKESDLNTYISSNRVNTIDDLKTADESNKVIAPGTKLKATGCTWYAVWATEK